MDVTQYAAKVKLLSDQITKAELVIILRELQAVLHKNVAGDALEFGCFVGTTSVHLQRFLQGSERELWVYDSFQGLPAKTKEDLSPAGEQFAKGELSASKAQLIKHFKQASLPLPHITKAWFSEVNENQVPPKVAFAFLDGDYYHSIRDPLKLIWPRLTPGAVVIIDDYANEALPGARRAVDEWLQAHPAKLRVEASLAIVRTPSGG